MTTRERRSGSRRRQFSGGYSAEETNPLDSMFGFSDVMLVLAVGIMLALVLHWNVPLGQPDQTGYGAPLGIPGIVSIDDSDLSKVDQIPDDSKRVGAVYYDEETGTYYILQENETDSR